MAIQVWIVDGYTQVAEVTRFARVDAIERDLAVGNWQLILPVAGNETVVAEIMAATHLGIEIADSATGWRYHGPATQRRRRVGGEQGEEVELRGYDMMDLLACRREQPDGNPSNWWVTPAPGTLALSVTVGNTLYFTGGPGAHPARARIRDLVIVDPPAPFGPVIPYQVSGQPLLEQWVPWFAGTPWTFRLGLQRTGNGGIPSARFAAKARAVAALVITPELYTGEIEIVETAAEATFNVVMGGQVEGAAEGVRHVAWSSLPEDSWLRRHREQFHARPSIRQQPSLDAELARVASATLERRSVEISDMELPGYGDTVNLGDLVTITYDPEQPPVVQPVIASRLVGDGGQWRRTVSFGTESVNPVRVVDNRITSVIRRLRQLEGQL